MTKYNYEYTRNDYKTPPVLYQKALNHWKIPFFILDVCCSKTNISAMGHYIDGIIDGLGANWLLYNWCNPPFNKCDKWVKKAFEEQQKGNKTAMLIPVRTETKYWHDYILYNPQVTIEWLRKGYKFLNKDNQEMGVFKNALAIVYFE